MRAVGSRRSASPTSAAATSGVSATSGPTRSASGRTQAQPATAPSRRATTSGRAGVRQHRGDQRAAVAAETWGVVRDELGQGGGSRIGQLRGAVVIRACLAWHDRGDARPGEREAVLLVERPARIGRGELEPRAAALVEEVDHALQDRGADAASPVRGVDDHVADHTECPVADPAADADHVVRAVHRHEASCVGRVEDGAQRPLVDRPPDPLAKLRHAREVVGPGGAQVESIRDRHRRASLIGG